LLTFAVSNQTDTKILVDDTTADGYAVTITYYGTDQTRQIPSGGTGYPFRIIIDGKNKTAEQIYAAVQSQLRKASDIDAGPGTVIGKTADSLLRFEGDKLITSKGVYIDNFNTNDTNRIDFYDQNNVKRTYPFVAAGTITFNGNLSSDANSVYRMYYLTNPSGNYGTATAVTVTNSSGVPITGNISSSQSIAFDFSYDSNTDGGRTAGTDAAVVVVAIGKSTGKYVSTNYTITRAVGQQIALVAEKERSYVNPV
jgi:hypothetical protein